MMLFRERCQIVALFLGLFLVGFGLALASPGRHDDLPEERIHVARSGFWKDSSLTVEAGREIAPWLIGGGIASLGGAYLMRRR